VRFQHRATTYEGTVTWTVDDDSILSHEKNHPGCISLVLEPGQALNDLTRTTAIEILGRSRRHLPPQ
jgi:hypothetical protein